MTLRPSKRTKIPLGALEPGESIIIRTETVKKGSEQMGTLRGLVHSLGEDGASLVVGIDWKYGKYLPRIWGAVLSVERGGNMADETTYKVLFHFNFIFLTHYCCQFLTSSETCFF